MKAILISRIDMPEVLAYAVEIEELLLSYGYHVALEGSTAIALGRDGEGEWLDETDADIVVAVGGDGTVLLAVRRMKRQIPIIGINKGHVGFLADLESSEAQAFFRNLQRKMRLEMRMRIALSAGGEPLGTALNEAVIVTERPAKMLRFTVVIDGIEVEEFRADGLVIATPTGSTAYAMSGGGPIVDPKFDGFLLVPLAPYMLSSRPHLIESSRDLRIKLESDKPAQLVFDGRGSTTLMDGLDISVKRADAPAIFIDAGKNFFLKVREKLHSL
ncbi:MAG: NAD(+)/NADH kinase [Methanofollis sp.]|uniref:NAD(+)/NADH kinase n=1 Tax=Methanofollis sp. TaxID=2052835 RepID=UPI00260348D1|nr:NAD(+)/NADH kinase [Methanofollis sp.]MDD4254401.1 NAD(+)/NADH kinase [Methanofollis sp.]